MLLVLVTGDATATTSASISVEDIMPEDHIVIDGDGTMHPSFRRRLGGSSSSSGAGCHKGCPTDKKYDPKCLEAAMPPYPICSKLSADEWVRKAIDGSSRCCGGDDISNCRCPVKTSDRFRNRIGGHCEGVEICKMQVLAMELAEADDAATTVERLQNVHGVKADDGLSN